MIKITTQAKHVPTLFCQLIFCNFNKCSYFAITAMFKISLTLVLVLKKIALIAKYAFHIFFCIKILGSENLRFSTNALTKCICRYVIECAPALSHDTPRLWRLVGGLAHDMKASIPFPSLITYSPLFYERLTERSDFLLWGKK